jgi:putative redox protein
MPAEIEVNYAGRLRCTVRHSQHGHSLVTDAAASAGGLGENFTPTDLVVVALGTCILTTMAMVGERHQLDLSGMSARLEKGLAAGSSHRIASIGMTIAMPPGLRLDSVDRDRLENAAQRCPVKQILHPDVSVRVDFVYSDGCLLPAGNS